MLATQMQFAWEALLAQVHTNLNLVQVQQEMRDDDFVGRLTVEEIMAEIKALKALLAPLMRRLSHKDGAILVSG